MNLAVVILAAGQGTRMKSSRPKVLHRLGGQPLVEYALAAAQSLTDQLPVLVIGHRAVLRALSAYFVQIPPAETPHLPMPLHTVIQLTPTAYGCEEERVTLEPRVEE